MSDENKRVLVVKLRTHDGGYIIKYADVTDEDYDRWCDYHDRQDYESMKREAPKVLRMQISVEDAHRRVNDPAVLNTTIFSMGHVYADEVLP